MIKSAFNRLEKLKQSITNIYCTNNNLKVYLKLMDGIYVYTYDGTKYVGVAAETIPNVTDPETIESFFDDVLVVGDGKKTPVIWYDINNILD